MVALVHAATVSHHFRVQIDVLHCQRDLMDRNNVYDLVSLLAEMHEFSGLISWNERSAIFHPVHFMHFLPAHKWFLVRFDPSCRAWVEFVFVCLRYLCDRRVRCVCEARASLAHLCSKCTWMWVWCMCVMYVWYRRECERDAPSSVASTLSERGGGRYGRGEAARSVCARVRTVERLNTVLCHWLHARWWFVVTWQQISMITCWFIAKCLIIRLASKIYLYHCANLPVAQCNGARHPF